MVNEVVEKYLFKFQVGLLKKEFFDFFIYLLVT